MKRGLAVALVLLTVVGALYYALRGQRERPNIVFVLIDTLRADHLGSYGYSRNTSPQIDDIASRGIRFENVFSVSNWTNPTIATLFTGQFPQAVFPPAHHAKAIQLALPPELPTLAGVLKSNGYKTIGLVDHPGIGKKLGFARGFDEYEMLYVEGAGGDYWGVTEPDYVLRRVREVLEGFGEEPGFLYLHLVYPHYPYEAPGAPGEMFGATFARVKRERRDEMINAYDGEIRLTDNLIGAIDDSLRELGLSDETYLILTSDHGEAFWEHGFHEHGKTFHNEVVKVPLIVLPPGGRSDEPPVVSKDVSNIDLFSTIMDFAHVPSPPSDGQSLTRLFSDAEGPVGPLFLESPHTIDINARAIVDQGRKYIFSPGRGMRHQLFALKDDARELSNLAEEDPQSVDGLLETLMAQATASEARRAALQSETVTPATETVERLRALGYVDN